MSLEYAILGLLKEAPRTGYEIKTQSFDQHLNHFWSADQAQIYRTLDRLEAQGWAASTLEVQQDHPNRKVYHITPPGEAALYAWLQTYQPPSTVREPFLVQFFFGADLSNDELVRLLEGQIAAHEARLAVYRCVALPPPGDPAMTRAQVLHRLTLERGIRNAESAIAWARHAIAVIRERPPADPG